MKGLRPTDQEPERSPRIMQQHGRGRALFMWEVQSLGFTFQEEETP